MKCQKCDAMSPEENRFCGKCGAELQIVCPGCGAVLYPSAGFCGQCGRSLEQPIASGVVCFWCKLGMGTDSKVCPHCGKLRVDIVQSRDRFRRFLLLLVFPLAAFLVGFTRNWWSALDGSFAADRFLDSVSGQVIIGVSAALLLLVLFFYYKTSRKMGTWVGI